MNALVCQQRITRAEVTCTICRQRVVIEWINGRLADNETGHATGCETVSSESLCAATTGHRPPKNPVSTA